MRTMLQLLVTGVGVLVVAIPTSAHHSRHATYNPDEPVTLEGTVTNLEWRNPHIWVFFDVKGEGDTVTSWACEGGAPNALFRRGWRPDSLKPGDTIMIEGEKARNGTPNCNMRSVTLGDGTRVFTGDADPAGDTGR